MSDEISKDSLPSISDGFFSSVEALLENRKNHLSNMENLYKYLAEVNWSKDKSHSKIYADFLSQITAVKAAEIKTGNGIIYLKMRFSYAVTLMESCLGEMLKSVTMHHEQFRRNAVINISSIGESQLSTQELLDKDIQAIIDSKVIHHISRILYHNMDKVNKVYTQILGNKFPVMDDDLNKKIDELMDLRHDIVHRNGKKIDGEEIELTPAMVSSCVSNIQRFVGCVHAYINESIEKL